MASEGEVNEIVKSPDGPPDDDCGDTGCSVNNEKRIGCAHYKRRAKFVVSVLNNIPTIHVQNKDGSKSPCYI